MKQVELKDMAPDIRSFKYHAVLHHGMVVTDFHLNSVPTSGLDAASIDCSRDCRIVNGWLFVTDTCSEAVHELHPNLDLVNRPGSDHKRGASQRQNVCCLSPGALSLVPVSKASKASDQGEISLRCRGDKTTIAQSFAQWFPSSRTTVECQDCCLEA